MMYDHFTTITCLDSSEDQEVLQSLVVTESTILKHNLLQQFDKLIRQVGSHESLDSS